MFCPLSDTNVASSQLHLIFILILSKGRLWLGMATEGNVTGHQNIKINPLFREAVFRSVEVIIALYYTCSINLFCTLYYHSIRQFFQWKKGEQ